MQFLRFRFHRFSPVCSHGMGFIVADYLSSVEITDVGIATLLKFVYDENTPSYPISPLYGCNSWLQLLTIRRNSSLYPRFGSTRTVRFGLGAQFISPPVYYGQPHRTRRYMVINLASHPLPSHLHCIFIAFSSSQTLAIHLPFFIIHIERFVILYRSCNEVDRCGHTFLSTFFSLFTLCLFFLRAVLCSFFKSSSFMLCVSFLGFLRYLLDETWSFYKSSYVPITVWSQLMAWKYMFEEISSFVCQSSVTVNIICVSLQLRM